MKIVKTLLIAGILLIGTKTFAQTLPPSYQPMLSEIVTFFETITGSNSISKGTTTLSVLDKNKVALKVKHKGQVKNLTFETSPDEENNLVWIAANALTIDMVNKYEDYLTKTLEDMYDLAKKRSME